MQCKLPFGSEPSPPPPGLPSPYHRYAALSPIYEVNEKSEQEASSIGNCSLSSDEMFVLELPKSSPLLLRGTGSPLGPKQQKSMFGKRILESPDRNSNLAPSQSTDPKRPTGGKCLPLQNLVISKRSRRTYLFAVILNSHESAKTLWYASINFRFQLQLRGLSKSSGDVQDLERVDLPGMKPVWMLSLKTHPQNGGTVTGLRQTLLSMSFEAVSQLSIFSAGSTAIRCVWKRKEEQLCSEQLIYGLPQICRLINGTQS